VVDRSWRPAVSCYVRVEGKALHTRRRTEDLAWAFVVARDAGANARVSATVDQELADSGLACRVVGECVKDRGLAADAIEVPFGAGVNIGAAIEEEAGRVEEAVFGGDVEEGRAAESEYAAARERAAFLHPDPQPRWKPSTHVAGSPFLYRPVVYTPKFERPPCTLTRVPW